MEREALSVPAMATARATSGGSSGGTGAGGDARLKKSDVVQGKDLDFSASTLLSRLGQLKKQVQSSRLASIKERVERNRKVLRRQTDRIFDAVEAAARVASADNSTAISARMASNSCLLTVLDSVIYSGEKEFGHFQEENFAAGTIAFISGGGLRTILRFVELPPVEKIPPYTTWMFLDKNQRMAEDQSIVGRRRIYYDPVCKEALLCSDSDEEIPEQEEEKHFFTESEDQIIWKAFLQYGLNEEAISIISQFLGVPALEIEERYKALLERNENQLNNSAGSKGESEFQLTLDKSLEDSLDSFDNLFCRRCLVFDCRLHGCNQNVIYPCERLPHVYEHDENKRPCGDKCYLRTKEGSKELHSNTISSRIRHESISKSATEDRTIMVSSESEELHPREGNLVVSVGISVDGSTPETTSSEAANKSRDSNTGASSQLDQLPHGVSRSTPQIAGDTEQFLHAVKRQKVLALSEITLPNEDALRKSNRLEDAASVSKDYPWKEAIDDCSENVSRKDDSHVKVVCDVADQVDSSKHSSVKEIFTRVQAQYHWSNLERELYLKGIEIFGRNSCLIARNLLSGLKTCSEIASFMQNRHQSGDASIFDVELADQEYMGQEQNMRNRNNRRRGKTRKLKYTWRTAGIPTSWKRIGDGKHQCRQYSPCGCQQMCGKECQCMENGTCCEKYCGCSKSCKNRFRGCHCAKSQCRSRQCPCFAAGRECDPDVCRNCWVSCGDGLLGEPPVRGDGYQCGNMKLLLKQRQRILLGKSDVAGWGAFIKNPVYKNDYLGEYTGELISHKEADKRGKIYDRANSSFLFDLNDQCVLDAYRKGDKLKFANHSANPNCYAKVMFVAGDHRVGIYAKEHIEASEELFYDYRYGPDQAPAWARKPEGSKRDEASVSHNRRAQKVA